MVRDQTETILTAMDKGRVKNRSRSRALDLRKERYGSGGVADP